MLSQLARDIDAVAREKNIPRDKLIEVLQEAMHAAARKKYGMQKDLEAQWNEGLGEVELFEFKTVSEEFAKANSVARRQLYHDNIQNAQKIIDQHSEILEAIRSRSPKAASEAMLGHLIFAEGELRKWIV